MSLMVMACPATQRLAAVIAHHLAVAAHGADADTLAIDRDLLRG